MFDETSAHFPFVLVVMKLDISDETLGQFPVGFVETEPGGTKHSLFLTRQTVQSDFSFPQHLGVNFQHNQIKVILV